MVPEKNKFKFLYVNDLGPMSLDLDLEYSNTFINSISCLHLPTFRSHVGIVYKKSTVITFSNRKAYVTKMTLPQNRSWSTQGHHLKKLLWAGITDVAYQMSWKSVNCFRRRGSLVLFTIFGRGGHLGHVTQMLRTKKKCFDWPSVFGEKDV